MKRIHAFEFCDQPWLPRLCREIFNDTFHFIHYVYGPYRRAAALISLWAARGSVKEILDLGSAGASHIEMLVVAAKKRSIPLPKIIASDLFPATDAWQALQEAYGPDVIGFIDRPLSIFEIPETAPRYWTIFTTLHHLKPADVRQFFEYFSHHGDGLCIAEYYQRNWYSIFLTILALPTFLFSAFFAKNIRLSKILLTLIVPLMPLIFVFDGIISILRTYTANEIFEMFPEHARDQFTFEHHRVWYGLAPAKSSVILITRKPPV